MPERVEIEFSGHPRALYVLVQDLEAEGLTVDYEPPLERRTADGGSFFAGVAVGVAGNLTTDAIKAAVKAVQRKWADRNLPAEVIYLPPREQQSWGSE